MLDCTLTTHDSSEKQVQRLPHKVINLSLTVERREKYTILNRCGCLGEWKIVYVCIYIHQEGNYTKSTSECDWELALWNEISIIHLGLSKKTD